MICSMIVTRESVTLLSSEIIFSITTISKSIKVLSYIKCSCIFEGNLWHKHDQCSVRVLQEDQDISKYKMIICAISENVLFQGLSR